MGKEETELRRIQVYNMHKESMFGVTVVVTSTRFDASYLVRLEFGLVELCLWSSRVCSSPGLEREVVEDAETALHTVQSMRAVPHQALAPACARHPEAAPWLPRVG
jgi:hypothetical protein